MDYIVVFITTSSLEEAKKIANHLVENKIAACINIVEKINSTFFWKGNIENYDESLLIVKTKRSLFNKLKEEVKKLHSYTVPEIIAIPIVEGSEDYLSWIDETVKE
ncbi:MAG: divalent-cation tolerance protein CutA [Sulfurihydrogenibium sp.]|uniref:divalent-cation tolerance protein CutA n=1 Tax=Sulfurihydrogenibium sp. TaxID=2053621 RepID=UPI000CCB6EAE|nr:MAG: cytochrome C biogenesis protein CcdA [Sulfurihydrogenibium sp.]